MGQTKNTFNIYTLPPSGVVTVGEEAGEVAIIGVVGLCAITGIKVGDVSGDRPSTSATPL